MSLAVVNDDELLAVSGGVAVGIAQAISQSAYGLFGTGYFDFDTGLGGHNGSHALVVQRKDWEVISQSLCKNGA
jgi:hypothetical protein